MTIDNDDDDDFSFPIVDDAAMTGAAADSSDLNERLLPLPRLLRYAMLAKDGGSHTQERLVAEISELCPGLTETARWMAEANCTTALALAAELDRQAVGRDHPSLRSLSDCVRLLYLPLPRGVDQFNDYRRVGKALVNAFGKACRDVDEDLCCELEELVFGWAALPACTDLVSIHSAALTNAAWLGPIVAKHRLATIKSDHRRKMKVEEERRAQRADLPPEDPNQPTAPDATEGNGIVVAQISADAMKNTKLKEILASVKGVINTTLPLVAVPPLHQIRHTLLSEFPYAADAIDFALADLVGRTTVYLGPLLIQGDVGSGKTLFARRLGELLGVSVWRADASRSDGAVFGGTDRRWSSAEPCHPLLAIAQGKIANPLILLDELDKSATRSDYGRLWDCLLGFLEAETNARYPDPALQVDLNLSHISYVATVNSLDPLPSPIRDRFRVVSFPKPRAEHLDALLPAVTAALGRERGLDERWTQPLDGSERRAIARHWHGGSVRRLRRIVEAILHHRETQATRN
ncbi:ATP-dependent Lon protease [Bradyrhizobium sp. LB9.1b]